jgi:hypothetical protein
MMVSNREEAIELLLTMSDITKEIAELMKGEAASPPQEEKVAPSLTLEEVRAELSKLSRAGKTSVVKQILAGFGASKLSEVDPAKYWLLMAQAQEANGSAQ